MLNLKTYLIENIYTYEDTLRYLKTKYNENYFRFKTRFLDPLTVYLTMHAVKNYKDIIKLYSDLWFNVSKFSYKEAFAIKLPETRALVFSVIDVPQMIKYLGTTRINTQGIELVNKVFNKVTKTTQNINFTQIYELHKVNGRDLGIDENLYAIKAWCTSTNEEHWLWLDKETGETGDALAGIASMCKIYEPMLGKIKHIIRQGDVFLFEMLEEIDLNGSEKIISLNKDTYFKLLKSQS